MPSAIDLSRLTDPQKDALILSLLPVAGQLQAALARIGELEAQIETLTRPPKTPDYSSQPPSSSRKVNRKAAGKQRRRRSGPGIGRALHDAPDRTVELYVETCQTCTSAFPIAAQTRQHAYDRIELPPIKPDVTRVHLFGGRCGCCGTRAIASAPAGLQPGSPFGYSVAAMAVYLHYTHAISLERLRTLMAEVFGLSISEGALCNILARARTPFAEVATEIAASVRIARVVCSDETSVRVAGRTWWEWVFVTGAAVLHLIRPSRGKIVPQEVFGGVRPGVWVSDALGSQRGHAEKWQMCLAHLLRDAQYAIDCGDAVFSTQFKALLLRAIAIGRRRPGLRDTTLAQYHADLDRRLDRIMATAPRGRDGEKLRKRIGRHRAHLFVFMGDRDVPPTNNISERHLRPSVIFRKVTNGFRSEWGAETYAAFRSMGSTAKIVGQSVLDATRNALTGYPLAGVG